VTPELLDTITPPGRDNLLIADRLSNDPRLRITHVMGIEGGRTYEFRPGVLVGRSLVTELIRAARGYDIHVAADRERPSTGVWGSRLPALPLLWSGRRE
jgi:hypothetical protein